MKDSPSKNDGFPLIKSKHFNWELFLGAACFERLSGGCEPDNMGHPQTIGVTHVSKFAKVSEI